MAPDVGEKFKKETYLHLLKKAVATNLIQNPLTRMYLISSIFIHFSYVVIASRLAVEKGIFHRYIPFILFYIPIISTLPITMIMSRYINKLKITTNMKFKDPNIEKIVTLDCRIFYRTSVIFYVMGFIAIVITAAPLFGDEHTFIPVQLILQEYSFPKTVGIATTIHTALSYMGSIQSIISGVYFTVLVKIQVYLVIDKLRSISRGFSNLKEDELMDDKLYQNMVYKRLIVCIKDHIEFIKFYKKAMEYNAIGIVFIPSATLIPVAVLYFILNDISAKSNFRMVLIMFVIIYVLVTICKRGQEVENVTHYLHRVIIETPWVWWDRRNRQALLIMLMNAEPVEVRAYNLITLNLPLLLTIFKWVYSLITVLI